MNRALTTIALAVLVAAGPMALAAEVNVTSTVVGGTRTMTLRGPDGGPLNGIALGTAGTAPFFTNVTDVQYSRAGYQVSANLSNLYAFDGATFDCTTSMPASSISLGFAIDPTSVSGVAGLTEATWDLAGTLTDPVATLLGVPVGTAISATDVLGEQIDRTLAGVYDGLEDNLPIKVDVGTGGAFTEPGPHADCAPSPSNPPTTYTIMDGQVNTLAELFAWVTGEVTSAADENTNGTVHADELVATGEVAAGTMSQAVRDALQAAGVNLALLDTLLAGGTITMDDIYVLLTATLDPVTSLIGQTGTYLSVPQLTATVPDQTPSGTYRGTLTVTLLDVAP